MACTLPEGETCLIGLGDCAWIGETVCFDGRLVCAVDPPDADTLAACRTCAEGGDTSVLGASCVVDPGGAHVPGAWACVDGALSCAPVPEPEPEPEP